MRDHIKKKLLFFLTAIASIPIVSADTGFQPLNRVVQIIAEFFTIPAIQSEAVQIGLLRFGLFMLVFAVAHGSLKKAFGGRGYDNNNRVAGVVSFVVAFIGVFFMPENWLIATGGTITAIIAGAIILGIIGGGIWMAINHRWFKGDAVKHFLGLIVLFILMHLIIIYKELLGLAVG